MTGTSWEELFDVRQERLWDMFMATDHQNVAVRERFLQTRGNPPIPGPLSVIVRGRHHQALDLYLLLLAAAENPPHQVDIHPEFWASIVRRPTQSLRNSRLAVARSLTTLRELQLVSDVANRRWGTVRLLCEDGSGSPYVHPSTARDRYVTLPFWYWLEGLDVRLPLAGKAVLLIARSLKPNGFTLPLVNAERWYGISPSTLQRGIGSLIENDLARFTSTRVAANNAIDETVRRRYVLTGAVSRRRTPEPPDANTFAPFGTTGHEPLPS